MATMGHQDEHRAIGEFRMISSGEANIRKIAGISIAIAVAIYQRISPSTLSAGPFAALIGAAIVIYRTGTCYQWGGILTGKWNLDGEGLIQIPVERGRRYAEFAENKKKEFVMQLLSSLSVGMIVGSIYGVTIRDEDFGDVITEILFWAFGALSATLLVSIMS